MFNNLVIISHYFKQNSNFVSGTLSHIKGRLNALSPHVIDDLTDDMDKRKKNKRFNYNNTKRFYKIIRNKTTICKCS
jgi:hypothetical protein